MPNNLEKGCARWLSASRLVLLIVLGIGASALLARPQRPFVHPQRAPTVEPAAEGANEAGAGPHLEVRMGVEQLRNPYWYQKHDQPGEAENFWDKNSWERALQQWKRDDYNAILYWPEPWTETAWPAFLIRHRDFPEARELSLEEANRVIEHLGWIFHRAHELGLKNFLFAYQVTTTKAFARVHGLDRELPVSAAVDFRHNMKGQMGPAFGVRSERTRAFTGAAIAELFQTYPDLDGIEGGMGEALPGKRSSWYKQAIVPGLRRSGRKPLSIVMNWMMPLEDFMEDIAPRTVYDNTWLSVHANVEMLTDARPYPMAVRWAEQAGVPTLLEIVHHNHEAGFPANSPRLAYEIIHEYKKVEHCKGFLAWFLRSDPNDLFRKALGYHGRRDVPYSDEPLGRIAGAALRRPALCGAFPESVRCLGTHPRGVDRPGLGAARSRHLSSAHPALLALDGRQSALERACLARAGRGSASRSLLRQGSRQTGQNVSR